MGEEEEEEEEEFTNDPSIVRDQNFCEGVEGEEKEEKREKRTEGKREEINLEMDLSVGMKALVVMLVFLSAPYSNALNWEEHFTEEQSNLLQRDENAEEYLQDIRGLNPGLHTECNTYKEKYDEARIAARLRNGGPNEGNPHSKYVILVKYHYLEHQAKDMMLALRATAAEAADSGLHFYILYQFPPGATKPINRQEMLNHLSTDLHPYVIFHDFKDTVSTYPKLAAQIEEGDGGPGPRGVYLAATHFMYKYPGWVATPLLPGHMLSFNGIEQMFCTT